jgi:hypothetical protein
LALQIGFLRMTGRLLEAVRVVPPALWRHLGKQFGVAAPDLASLRTMYQRRRTLFEHQEVACETLGFHWLSEAQRRALVRACAMNWHAPATDSACCSFHAARSTSTG